MLAGINIKSEDAAYFSILFDIGGIIGGILAGLATDYTGKSATTCAVMLIAAIPAVSLSSLAPLAAPWPLLLPGNFD
jgi:OPA family glycerol-3-phosphate transporter-like MFS transporter 1/2